MTMNTDTPANVTNIDDATAARWLTETLEPARARAKEGPTASAIERIRARIFGDAAAAKKDRSIAA
jgi:hypothetical protein